MFIDLTMEISEGTQPFPGDPKLEIKSIATIDKNEVNERRISLNSHFGTHIDAPYHMLPNGKKLDEYPIESFIGKARIVDVRGVDVIDKEHLTRLGNEPIVLFYTGHTRKAFEKDFFKNNPVFSPEAAYEIIKHKITIVGIDSFTPDNYPYTVHKILFGKNILIVENLVNLNLVGSKCKLYVAPLYLKSADGAPARVFAEI